MYIINKLPEGFINMALFIVSLKFDVTLLALKHNNCAKLFINP
jgi:hypothetical protein